MITKAGKNFIRDVLCGASTGVYVNKCGLGTVSTDASESDTGLNGNTNFGIADTINDVTYSTVDKQIVFDYNLKSTEGTGVTFTEIGLNVGTSSLFNRQTFYDFLHNDTEEWQLNIAISIK
jgi:hypothetical protein